jgi:cytochrome P450
MSELPLPQGPAGQGRLGVLREMRDDPLGLYARAHAEFGAVVRLDLGRQRAYLVSDPKLYLPVFVDAKKRYGKFQNNMDRILGEGLLTSEGPVWRKRRTQVQPVFSPSGIAHYADATIAETAALLAARRDLAAGTVLDVDRLMYELALRVAVRALFGMGLDSDAASLHADLDTLMADSTAKIMALQSSDSQAPFDAALARLDALVYRILDAPDDGRSSSSLLTALRTAVDEDGHRLDRTQLRDEIITFLVAGHETTSTSLAWTLHLLATHPDIAAAAKAQIDAVLGTRAPAAADCQSLGLVRRIIQESMRLYPPIWRVSRTAAVDDEIAGFAVPAGTTIIASQYVVHRDPAYWPDPLRFDPDRFAEPNVKARPKGVYFPFGLGPRACIGAEFAMIEATLILAMLLREVRFALVEGGAPARIRPLYTLRPAGELLLKCAAW